MPADSDQGSQAIVSWVLTIAFVLAVFLSLFLYMGIGMAGGERAANMFLVTIVLPVALGFAGIYWWRSSRKKEP